MSDDKKRIGFDINEVGLARIDAIKMELGCMTRAEAIRTAIALTSRVLKLQREVGKFGYLDKDTGEFQGIVFLPMGGE